MLKVYVAGPMTGRPAFNYPAFAAAAVRLAAAGFEPLNPTGTTGGVAPSEAEAKPWDFYLRAALRLVVEADGIALLPDWQRSRGATLEAHVGAELGMRVAPLSEWLAVPE